MPEKNVVQCHVVPNPELVSADDDPRHFAGLLIVDQNMGFVLVNHACLLVEFVCLCIQNDIPESSNWRQYHQQHSKNNADLKNMENTGNLEENRLSR